MANDLTAVIQQAEAIIYEYLGTNPVLQYMTNVTSMLPNSKSNLIQVPESLGMVVEPLIAAYTPSAGQSDIKDINRTLDAEDYKNMVKFDMTNEEELKVQRGVQENAVNTAVNTLMEGVTSYILQIAAQGAYQTSGTPGTTPYDSGDTTTVRASRVFLNTAKAPRTLNSRIIINDPDADGKAAEIPAVAKANEYGLRGSTPGGSITNVQGDPLGFRWDMSQEVYNHTAAAAGTRAAVGSNPAGARQITFDNGAGAAPAALNKGDKFTIAGVTGSFTATADSVLGTNQRTVQIDPPLPSNVTAASAFTVVTTDWVGNIAFARGSLVWAARDPAVRTGPFTQPDRFVRNIVDPNTGFPLQLEGHYLEERWQWKVKVIMGALNARPSHTAVIYG